jgi:hypothetical protein
MVNVLIEAEMTDAYKNFINTLDSEVSKENYRFAFSKFMKFCRLEEGDYDKMLRIEPKKLEGIPNSKFSRWRCDPPYNTRTAKEMYGTDLPRTIELLKAGARVCKVGSLMFLLLGPKNYQ